MKCLNSKRIKKILMGIMVSDGSIYGGRFDLYSKSQSYIDDVDYVLSCITNMHTKQIVKIDNRFQKESIGHRIFTRRHMYLDKLHSIFYKDGRKILSKYICGRLDAESFAHIWMCDGYLEHAKNRKINHIQNLGWLCLESFPKEELELMIARLRKLGVDSRVSPKPWGFGYRIKITGESLQKFISMIYPYIHNDFHYKTELYYLNLDSKFVNLNLSNAEQYLKTYTDVEDIVRHSW